MLSLLNFYLFFYFRWFFSVNWWTTHLTFSLAPNLSIEHNIILIELLKNILLRHCIHTFTSFDEIMLHWYKFTTFWITAVIVTIWLRHVFSVSYHLTICWFPGHPEGWLVPEPNGRGCQLIPRESADVITQNYA